jgi:hypothetical protein
LRLEGKLAATRKELSQTHSFFVSPLASQSAGLSHTQQRVPRASRKGSQARAVVLESENVVP